MLPLKLSRTAAVSLRAGGPAAAARLSSGLGEKKKKKNAPAHTFLFLFSPPPVVQPVLFSLNTMSGSHVSNNDPAVIEKELRRSLEGHVPARVPTAPQWSEVLASESEAVVKAEVHGAGHAGPGSRPAEPGDVSGDIAELQAHTIRVVREETWLDTVVDAPPPKGGEDPLTRGSNPN